MRVAFFGSAGTGKTVLSQWITEAYGLEYNPVGSRSVAKNMGFESPYDVDAAGARAEFQRRLITEKTDWESSHESFVTDRTPFDNLAYTTLHDMKCITQEMVEQAIQGMSHYTHVIYCPESVFINIANDPQRHADLTYHNIYDAVLRGLINKFSGRNFLTLDVANLESRKQRIQVYLLT